MTRMPTEKTETSAGEITKAPTSVVCRASSMVLELPKEPLKRVLFLDKSNQWVAVIDAHKYCNYTLSQGIGRNFFITPYTACDVRILNKNYVLKLWYLTTGGEKGYVLMKCPTSAGEPTEAPTPTTTTRKPTEPVPIATTICRASTMMVVLPPGPLEEVLLIAQSNKLVPVKDAPKYCNYSLVESEGRNIFITPYTTCNVKILNKNYVLTLHYTTTEGVFGYVGMKCPTSAALPTRSPLPPFGVSVICSDTCMTVELPGGLLEDIQLMDESNNLVAVASAPKTCGYSLVRGNDKNFLTAPYNACNVKILNNFYILRVLYTTLTGQHGDIHAKCPVPGLVPREGCKIPRSQQVACGPPNADPQLCVANGCCVDCTTSQCYYPLDACTADGHFVFAVYRTSTKPEIDPGSLVIVGNQSCAPVICTPDFAIFKFPVTGCGTHVFMVAETTIYLAEVHGMVRGTGQVYGEITRDSSYRLQVECRYSKGSLASTGYLVVNPLPPSAALAFGSLGVRLRIATDASYTTFHPLSHLPLSFLLGSKVYLEVQLMNPPDPNVVLLVHYCIAYPQSSQAAWVILYEGCPNILDYSSAAGLHVEYDNMPVSKHTRRFEIQGFQFLDYKTKQHLDEDIYFMCSTEVCSPKRSVCNEGCFDGRDMPVPVDLGVGGRCAGKPCPGNVVKRAAHGEGTFILDENVPHEQTEKHWTHFHGLLGLLGLLVPVSVVILFLKKWVVWKLSDPGEAV
ncbi:zona pellucida sperm-binding protein 4-like [Acipenser ruthenus]|uniref:zona pellucida sperm-binding protein 4-like n=1 Tax=Acipenser ruthenus TaxID=7906 RepID=UPI00274251A8|nr:zona pellucida sperm-binding protein 4-like [Acipenser ruthenus]